MATLKELPNISNREYTKQKHKLIKETITQELSDVGLPFIVDNIYYTNIKENSGKLITRAYTTDNKLLKQSINPDDNYELYDYYATSLRLDNDNRGFGYYSEVSFFYVIRYYYDYEFIPKIFMSEGLLKEIFELFLKQYPDITKDKYECNCYDYKNLQYFIYDIYVFQNLVSFLRNNDNYLRLLIL